MREILCDLVKFGMGNDSFRNIIKLVYNNQSDLGHNLKSATRHEIVQMIIKSLFYILHRDIELIFAFSTPKS